MACSTQKFTGEIPKELGSLAKLDSLLLADNKLVGTIPAELASLTTLTALVVMNNHLSGPPFDEVLQMLEPLAPMLESLVLSGNGPIGGTVLGDSLAKFARLQVRKTPSWPRSWANVSLF